MILSGSSSEAGGQIGGQADALDAAVYPPLPTCGDGTVDPEETCDDGNTRAGDGCSSDCTVREGGFDCITPGRRCIPDDCGDGMLTDGETCDDGNLVALDGCDEGCQVEPGYSCGVPGANCTATRCGDGIQAGRELCDDGNAVSGDGCSDQCELIEPGFVCPESGRPCVSFVECGDGVLGPGEECEDGNTASLDGCSANCKREPGFTCSTVGVMCKPVCGDGILVAGMEACEDDDETPTSGDGCSATCALERGFHCPIVGETCLPTVCNDGIRQGLESCDDGNLEIGDGCTPFCEVEPDCSEGACKAECGDGFVFPSEGCDDGNMWDGDGCSSRCEVEPGFRCSDGTMVPPETLQLTTIVRDFIGRDKTPACKVDSESNDQPCGHPHFQTGAGDTGKKLVKPVLDADGLPEYSGVSATTIPSGTGDFFDWWYRTDPRGFINRTFPVQLELLTGDGGATYVFDDSTFFPFDKEPVKLISGGFVETGDEPERLGRNYNFTSEARFFFKYNGGETLSFRGDDDVWVFINGILAVDLSGVHGAISGSVALSGASCDRDADPECFDEPRFQLRQGEIYEAVVLQAERQTSGSNYKLTLAGFFTGSSTCESVCGDGIRTMDEACDDGVNEGGYGGCMPGCLARGPFCGDGEAQEQEICDDGANISAYGGCGVGCTAGPACGDGLVQAAYETCDDGVNGGAFGGCNPDCTRAGGCGDGIVDQDHAEECDDGNLVSGDGCDAECRVELL